MTTTPTITGTRYVGWFKRSDERRWRRVTEADTADEALTKLQAYADTSGVKSRDLVVLPAGLDPNDRRRRR